MSVKKTILLVEDDAIIALTSQRQLEQYGYNVIHRNTGEKAVEAIKTIPEIDLILMDINLGNGIDGTQAAEIILKDYDIPIVFVSSHTEPEIVEKTEKITSYGYVVKATGITVLDSSIKMAFKLFDANKAIKSSELKQKTLISNISDVIGIMGVDGILKYKSTNIEKWFGWKPEDLVGTDGWLTVHPDDLERIRKEFYEILKTDNLSSNVEYRYKCKDGSYKMIELTATNLVNTPAVNGVLLNYHDITARIKVQEALHDSEEKYRLQFLNVNSYNSMYEVVRDEEGKPKDFRFVMVNQAYEKYVGKKASDLIGKTLLEVYPETESYWINKMTETVLTGIPVQLEAFSKEMNIYTEVSLYTPQKGFLAMATANISERKKAEELLRESEEKFRLLHESAGIGIGYYSLDGIVLSYNNLAAKHMGGVPEDFIGKSIFDLFPKPDAEAYLKRIKAASSSENSTVYEDKVSLSTGDLYFLSTFTKITDKKNGVLGIQIISQDITQRKNAELAVIESNEIFRTFANIAPVGIYLTNQNGDCTYANPAWCRMAGLSLEEAKGQGWINGLHPDDANMVFSKWTEMVASKGEWGLEYRFQNRSGVVTDVFGLATAQFDNQGNVLKYIGVNIDITERKKAESIFLKNEQRYRIILQTAMDGYWLADTQGNILDVNEAYCRMSGYCKEELLTMRISDIVFPESASEIKERMQRIIRNGAERFDSSHHKKDGSLFDVEVSVQFLSNEGDHIVSFFRDITERKKTEKALHESEERFQYAMNASNDGLFDWNLETNAIYYSPRWKSILGYEEHEIPNDFSIWETTTDPEDVKKSWELQQKLILNQIDRFVLEFRMKHKNGHWIDVLSRAKAIFNNDGKAVRIVGIHTDISERMKAEEALRDREEKYSSILLSMNDAIYSVDANSFELLQTNDAIEKIFGRPKEDFYANPGLYAEMVHPDDSAIITASAKEIFENKTGEWIYRIVRTDGEIRWVSDRSKLVCDEKGNAARIDCIFTDITERKLAEEQIKSLLAEKELILKEVHHRIKNNMNTVSGLLAFQAGAISEPSAKKALEDAGNRIRSMSLLYDKLYRSVDYTNVSVKDYLPTLIDEIVESFPNSQVVKIEKTIQQFMLDAKRLQPLGIIINELLANIMKYAFIGRSEGLIIVSAINRESHVIITIQDNGNGISESVSFEKSTGFGLQLVQALTQQLDGTIRIERKNGTKIVLEFDI